MLRMILALLTLVATGVIADGDFKVPAGGGDSAANHDPDRERFIWVRRRVDPPWLCAYIVRVPWYCEAAESVVFSVKPQWNTVDSLKKAVRKKMGTDYTGNPANIIVYPPATPISAYLDDGPMTLSTAALDATDAVDNPWHSAKNPFEFDLPSSWGVVPAVLATAIVVVSGASLFGIETVLRTIYVRSAQRLAVWRATRMRGLKDLIRSATCDKPDPAHGKPLGALKLPQGEVWLTHPEDKDKDSTFIRPVYGNMFDSILAARNLPQDSVGRHVLFIGNPGIGKSWALNYFLYRVLNENNHGLVMLRTPTGHVYAFLPNGSALRFNTFPGETWVNDNCGGQRALLLYDVGGKGERMAHGISFGNTCVVVASSPTKNNYGLFKSQYQPVVFYVPTWSEAEFVARFHGTANALNAKAEFEKYGGVLREAFIGAERQRALERAIDEFDFGRATVAALHENDTHRIVKLSPIDDNHDFAMAFHSRFVEDLWWEKKFNAVDERVVTDIFSKLSSPNRELYGKLFEKYVHKVARDLKFAATEQLKATGAPSASAEFTTFKPPAEFVVQETDDSRLVATVKAALGKAGRWVVPAAPNFPVFDAFLVVKNVVYGVQVTISAEHAPSPNNIIALEKQFLPAGKTTTATKQAVHAIIWVVDEVQASGARLATRQDMGGDAKWNAVPQYRILVSCKEHSHK